MSDPVHKVRWGILGVARIATAKVIPAMQQGAWSAVTAIASRDRDRADEAARALGIARAYASYEDLLADPAIDAIYNPLPNHLHVPWTIRAAEAGKHVLCEKPIALSAADANELIVVRNRTGVLIQEAFMVRTAPQWIAAREIVRDGRIGTLRSISGFFSYFNEDAANVRNVAEYGGGALLDIGCYLVHTARLLFGREPVTVSACVDRDPRFGVDRLSSLMLDFGDGQAIGTCATQLAPYQRVQVFGTEGRLEIEIPFNAPPDRPCRMTLWHGVHSLFGEQETIEIPAANQYTIQGDLFSRAIREHQPAPYPLEDSVLNMRVIDALFRSAAERRAMAVG